MVIPDRLLLKIAASLKSRCRKRRPGYAGNYKQRRQRLGRILRQLFGELPNLVVPISGVG